jgi:hypothetical protein
MKFRATLTNKNITRDNGLITKFLDPQTFGLGIAAVAGTAACFFMRH